MLEGHVLRFGLSIDQGGVTLIESSAACILSREPDRYAVEQQRAECKRFGHSVVHRARAAAHLQALLEEPLDLGMDAKSFRVFRKRCGDFAEAGRLDTCI